MLDAGHVATIAVLLTIPLYTGAGVAYLISGKPGQGLAFICWALANLALAYEGGR